MLLSAKNLTKTYGTVIGVNDITVDLEPGVYGLVGPNGAGKSTLLNLLVGQLRPSEGSLSVMAQDPWRNTELNRRIGICPQQDISYDYLTGREFVTLFARMQGLSPAQATEATNASLAAMGCESFADRAVRTYSKGMRQRTKLAQAMAHDPDLLVLDEPMTGADPLARRDIVSAIDGFAKRGKSVIVSSHVLHEVEAMTSHFVLMIRGRVLAMGDISEMRGLMDRFPHQIEIACVEPKKTALTVMEHLPVSGVRLHPSEGRIEVETRDPSRFYQGLTALAGEGAVEIGGLTSKGDSLDDVFQQLLGDAL